jgi:aldose 1-epimerase
MDGCRHLDLGRGDVSAVVCTTGAALVRLAVGGRIVVDGMAAAGEGGCRLEQYRGSVLAPWPGRVAGAVYEQAGVRRTLPVNDPGTGTAMHGLVAHRVWRVAAADASSARLEVELGADPGYPFAVTVAADYALSAGGVGVRIAATNRGVEPAPVGLGAHPYVTAAPVDATVLHVPAGTVVALDERGLPGDGAPAGEAAAGFTAPRQVGAKVLDHAFTDLARDGDGWAAVRLSAPGGRPVTVGLGPTARWVGVFTSDTLAPPAQRAAIAVEPMTCPPDALNSGRDLAVLAPGGQLVLEWAIRV